jgi:hypothetical protein
MNGRVVIDAAKKKSKSQRNISSIPIRGNFAKNAQNVNGEALVGWIRPRLYKRALIGPIC